MPPVTRSSSKDRSPESQENFNSPKPSRKANRISLDAVDTLVNEPQYSCKECNKNLEVTHLNSKDMKLICEVKDCFWLCDKCEKLPTNGKLRSFHKVYSGGFFDPDEDSSTPQTSSEKFASFSGLYNILKRCIFNETLCEVLDTFFSRKLIYAHLILILLVGINFRHLVYSSPMNLEPEFVPIEEKIEDSFRELENNFPQQDDKLWDDLITGFTELAINNDSVSPAVFLILHSDNTKTSFCLIKQVCNLAHEHLKFASKPLLLDGTNLKNRYPDYGEFIVDITENIQSRKISVIKNLHKVPGNLAQAFHGLTDAYHPAVEKVIYLMSLPKNESLHSDNIFEFAENILYESWRDVKKDSLGPLVTRLTNNVVQIKDESSFPAFC